MENPPSEFFISYWRLGFSDVMLVFRGVINLAQKVSGCLLPPGAAATFPLAAFCDPWQKEDSALTAERVSQGQKLLSICNALVGIDDPGFVCFSKNSDLHSN